MYASVWMSEGETKRGGLGQSICKREGEEYVCMWLREKERGVGGVHALLISCKRERELVCSYILMCVGERESDELGANACIA